MAFPRRAHDGPTLNAGLVAWGFFQGIRTSIAKKPYIFIIFVCVFMGGGGGRVSGPPVSPSRSAHEQERVNITRVKSIFDKASLSLSMNPSIKISRTRVT